MARSRPTARPTARQRPLAQPPRRRFLPGPVSALLLALALAGAAGWAYSTSFAGVFVFDDRFAIVENPNIKALWPLTRAMSAPPEAPVSGRPVASLTLAINYALAPPEARDVMAPGEPSAPPGTPELFLRNVWGYHFLNLTLHLLAALALLGVVRRTLLTEGLRPVFGEHATAIAFTVALVWVVHPLLTDAVTYITQRTEVLMGLFYLVTLYCAIRAAAQGTGSRTRTWWVAAAVAACAAGMGSKQTMVTAPLAVALWDWFFDRPTADGTRAPRWPLYAGLAGTWLLLAALVAYERWPTSIGFNLEGWTPYTYLLTQTRVLAHYLRLAVLGSPLVLDYDGWPMSRSVLEVAPYALALALVLAVTVAAALKRRPWAFLAATWFLALAPSSSVLPLATEIAAERRMYLPLASLVAAAVIAAYLAGRRVLPALVADPRRRRLVGTSLAFVLAGGVAFTYGTMTSARNRDYWSDERIWGDAVEKRPTNARARLNYGADLVKAGRAAEAAVHLREAVRLKDSSAPAHANLGASLCALGRLEEGVVHLERALALDPQYTQVYGNLGEAYGALGRHALAAKYFGLAVEATPDTPFLMNRLGWLLATSTQAEVRDGARAVRLGERAVELTSRQDAWSLNMLAAAYAETGRFEAAVGTVREALVVAQRTGQQAFLPELATRLALYARGEPYRE